MIGSQGLIYVILNAPPSHSKGLQQGKDKGKRTDSVLCGWPCGLATNILLIFLLPVCAASTVRILIIFHTWRSNPILIVNSECHSRMPPQSEFEETFPPRGSMQLCRRVEPSTFTCIRWGQEKRSKLVAFGGNKQDEPLCNGCYGRLLSSTEERTQAS